MAEIREAYALSTLVDYYDYNEFNVFPATNYKEKDTLVITTSINTVCLLKLTDTKPFKSWSAKQSQRFTCPVVFDRSSNSLACVQNFQVLRKWTGDMESLDSAEKIKFTDRVKQLLPVDNETLVIFENGDCATLKVAIQNRSERQKHVIESDERIISSQVIKLKDKFTIVHRVTSKDSDDLSFYILNLSLESGIVTESSKTKLENRNSFRNWSLVVVEDIPVMFTLWNDGEILKHPISSLETFTSIKLLPTSLNWIFIRFLDSNNVIVCASESEGTEIQIWDFKFRVCKAKRKINVQVNGCNQIQYMNDTLLIQTSNHIHCCMAKVTSSSLASSIGGNMVFGDGIPLAKKLRWTSLSEDNMEEDDDKATLSVSVLCKEELCGIIEKKNVKEMMKCLQKYIDIPESQLADLLKFVLETEDKLFESIDTEILFKNDFFSEKKTSSILCLLTQSYNDVFLYQYLNRIPTKETLVLLRFLNFWIKESMVAYRHIDKGLTIQEAVTWINMFLDSHYNDILLLRDNEVQEFLIELNETVDEYFEVYDEVEDLANLIQTIQKGKRLPQAHKQRPYHIEMLVL